MLELFELTTKLIVEIAQRQHCERHCYYKENACGYNLSFLYGQQTYSKTIDDDETTERKAPYGAFVSLH